MLVLQCKPKVTSWETVSKGKHTMETKRDLLIFSLLKVFKMYFIELFYLNYPIKEGPRNLYCRGALEGNF